MNKKNALTDPSLWILTITNVYMVWYYYQHPGVFTTLIWAYWAQSMMMGLFNFSDILTTRAIERPGNDASRLFKFRRPAAFFFIFHYGFFHLVYFVFLLKLNGAGTIQWDLLKYFCAAFLAGQIVTFVQHKIQQRTQQASLGKMFLTPYLRIIPMHLTILLPHFLPVSNMGIFLVMKSVTDVMMYLATRTSNNKTPEADKTMLTANREINM